MTASALNFKPIAKGALLGFFDLRYHGLTIKGCRLLESNGGVWFALPQVKTEQDGETKYFDQMFLSPPEMDHVRRLVVADLEHQGHIQYRQEPKPARRPAPRRDDDLPDLSAYKSDVDDGLPF